MSLIQLLQNTLEYCVTKYQLPSVILKFGKQNKCVQRKQQWEITVRAYWHQAKELATATLLHQIAHCIQHYQINEIGKHNEPSFKDIECELLTEFGLCPSRYNKQASYYAILQTADGRHRWNRGAAWNRYDIIQGTFSNLIRPVVEVV